MNELEVKRVPFMGTDLMAAKDESGTIWAGVRWMCEGLGLSRNQRDGQIQKIKADSTLSKGAENFPLPTAGGKQSVLCLKLDFVPLWLAKINITPAMQAETPELAERLEAYQLKAKDVLASAFLPKKARGGEPKPMTDYQQMMAEKWERDHALTERLKEDTMRHFYIRKAGILLAKTAFLAFGLGAIWMMLSLVEPDGYPWWLVTLASVGSMCLGCTFLIGAMVAEYELNEDMARAKQVPVRKIDRRYSA